MSAIPSNSAATASSDSAPADGRSPSALQDLDLDHFLQLMIAELQNQDPLDPMDNSQMLEQISTIREISSTDKLNDTLAAVRLGQDLSTAGTLIGKEIRASSTGGREVRGIVERAALETNEQTDVRELFVHLQGLPEFVLPAESDGTGEVRFSARRGEDDLDGVIVNVVHDVAISKGSETVEYVPGDEAALTFHIRQGQTTIADLAAALGRHPDAAADFTLEPGESAQWSSFVDGDQAGVTQGGGFQNVPLERIKQILPVSTQ